MRATSPSEDVKRPERTLTAEELESALELLSTEMEPAAPGRELWVEIFLNVLVGCLFFGLLTGLVVIWFDLWWGVGLLTFAGASFVLFLLSPDTSFEADVKRLRSSIGDAESIKVVADVWANRTPRSDFVLFGGLIFILVGAVWLVGGLLAEGKVRAEALLVLALANVTVWVWFSYDNLQEVRYYEQVESIRQRFQEFASEAGQSDAEIGISKAELNVLAKAEAHQTQLTVSESARQLPLVLEHSYAVSITPKAFEELEEIHRRNANEWLQVQMAINSLQDDPRPAPNHQETEASATLTLVAGPHEVDYVVDEDSQYVSVVGIGAGKPDRASDHG